MADRTTRYRVAGDDNKGVYYRLTPAGRAAVAQGKKPEKVAAKHRVYVVGYRDSDGKQRWQTLPPKTNLTAAKGERDAIRGAKYKGEKVLPNRTLRFAEAAERWLAAPAVASKRPTTQAAYSNAVDKHLVPRWGAILMDDFTAQHAADLVHDMREQGKGEWTISAAVRAGSRVFRHAARFLRYAGANPFATLEIGEKADLSKAPDPRPYVAQELPQVLAASSEPWTTLLRLAAVTGARESELLGLTWQDVELSDLATIRFTHQADRRGRRVELKTKESKATLPLPRSAAVMLLEHKARSTHVGSTEFVFATRTGKALSQRNVLRALYVAQERARKPDGTPTFPELFVHEHGHLVVADDGGYVLREAKRRDLSPLPTFHSLRHTAAMDCYDVEEARDLLRHKNSNVTRVIYRAHFADVQRESLRAKLEARSAAVAPTESPAAPSTAGEVVPIGRTAAR